MLAQPGAQSVSELVRVIILTGLLNLTAVVVPA